MTVANRGAYRRPVSNEEAVRRDRRNGLPIHGEYGSQAEAKGYIRRRHRQKAGLMRQFTKQADGPCGNTEAFREGWDRIFGRGAKATTQPERVRKTIGRGTRIPGPTPIQAIKTLGRKQPGEEARHAEARALLDRLGIFERGQATAKLLASMGLEFGPPPDRTPVTPVDAGATTPQSVEDPYRANFDRIDWGRR